MRREGGVATAWVGEVGSAGAEGLMFVMEDRAFFRFALSSGVTMSSEEGGREGGRDRERGRRGREGGRDRKRERCKYSQGI